MRLDVISDIHLTMFKDQGAKWVANYQPVGETLALAGDVAEFHWWALGGYFVLKDLCAKYKNVLFVPGNHEYYHSSFAQANERFADLGTKIANFHYLNEEEMEIDGVKFAGATMWFRDDLDNDRHAQYLSDFRLIQNFVPHVYHINKRQVEFLNQVKADVIITHHMPHKDTIHPQYRGDDLNRFFLCEMDVEKIAPKVWIHGHTHKRHRFMVDKTEIVCNPLGYPNENPGPYGPVTVEL